MTDILEELKQELYITWNDDNTDTRLINIQKRAEYKINEYAGVEVNIAEDLEARSLLVNLCRYMWNNVEDQFEANYRADVLMLRAKYRVAAMKNESQGEETEI